MVGGIVIFVFAQVLFSTVGIVVSLLAYFLVTELLWWYSPYTHNYTMGSTAPEVVKTQEWGFEKS